jgi:hypothetical protein
VGSYLQPTTLAVMELVMRDGRLAIGRTGGPVLVPVTEKTFRPDGGPAEVVFTDGAHAGLEVRQVGGKGTLFERQPPAVISKAALAPYAGEYYSEELDARYRVTAGDSTITLRTGTADAMQARPVFMDGFLGGGYTIQFTRKSAQVTGFEVTDGRMRRVKFVRASRTP